MSSFDKVPDYQKPELFKHLEDHQMRDSLRCVLYPVDAIRSTPCLTPPPSSPLILN